jgi:hypothetical protein
MCSYGKKSKFIDQTKFSLQTNSVICAKKYTSNSSKGAIIINNKLTDAATQMVYTDCYSMYQHYNVDLLGKLSEKRFYSSLKYTYIISI